MIIIDANLLLYAYNADAPHQKASAMWLEELFESGEIIGLPWVTMWAFIRISTNSRIWANPRSAKDAFSIVGGWLRGPGVLAALAVENGAVLASTDQDFRRFPTLRWLNPLGT